MKTHFTAILLVLSTALFLSSCTPENRVYEEHQELSPNIEWHQGDRKTFEVPIQDTAGFYDFSVAFRYAQGLPWGDVKIMVEETTPSGVKSSELYTLTVKDANGDYIGEAGGDIWDSSHLIEPKRSYTESGTYTYVLSHQMPDKKFPFAMEIGLVIDKVITSTEE